MNRHKTGRNRITAGDKPQGKKTKKRVKHQELHKNGTDQNRKGARRRNGNTRTREKRAGESGMKAKKHLAEGGEARAGAGSLVPPPLTTPGGAQTRTDGGS